MLFLQVFFDVTLGFSISSSHDSGRPENIVARNCHSLSSPRQRENPRDNIARRSCDCSSLKLMRR